jgi:hypothetical protein
MRGWDIKRCGAGVVDPKDSLDPPPRLRETRRLRDIFLIAQPPLLARRGDAALLSVAITVLMTISTAAAQVPAGVAYEEGRHPNPIVTWVNEKDFRRVPFVEAAEQVGVELMSLSRDVGERQFAEIATPSTSRQRIRVANEEFEVTFYPVMRQTYRLKSGKGFVLYTFRFPRALTTAEVLNDVAFARPPRGMLPRFGVLRPPERIDVRGVPGLYFDTGGLRTIYWFEMGAGYSVTTTADKEELFKVLEDLL